eukprot:COSAG06_NODE_8125_length_2267_cov_4.959425_1_plen_326_part_10
MITNLQGDLKQRMEAVVGAQIRSVETHIEELVKTAAGLNSFENEADLSLRAEHTPEHELNPNLVEPGSKAANLSTVQEDSSKGHGHGQGDSSGSDNDNHGHGDHGHGHDDHGLDWGTLRYLFDSDDAVEVALLGLLSQPKYNPKLVRKDDSCEKAGRWTLPCVARGIMDYQKVGLGAMVTGRLFDTHQFRELGELRVWKDGDIIQHQGEWSKQMLWYICNGQVATFHTHRDGSISKTELRHRSTVVGETGFFVDQPRYGTLQVVEDGTETVAFSLENYRELAQTHPKTAEYLHMYVVEMQMECIKHLHHEVHMLLNPPEGITKANL